MALITIDGKDYESDSFSQEGKNLVQSMKFAKAELLRLNAQIAILKTAESSYSKALKAEVEKNN